MTGEGERRRLLFLKKMEKEAEQRRSDQQLWVLETVIDSSLKTCIVDNNHLDYK